MTDHGKQIAAEPAQGRGARVYCSQPENTIFQPPYHQFLIFLLQPNRNRLGDRFSGNNFWKKKKKKKREQK